MERLSRRNTGRALPVWPNWLLSCWLKRAQTASWFARPSAGRRSRASRLCAGQTAGSQSERSCRCGASSSSAAAAAAVASAPASDSTRPHAHDSLAVRAALRSSEPTQRVAPTSHRLHSPAPNALHLQPREPARAPGSAPPAGAPARAHSATAPPPAAPPTQSGPGAEACPTTDRPAPAAGQPAERARQSQPRDLLELAACGPVWEAEASGARTLAPFWARRPVPASPPLPAQALPTTRPAPIATQHPGYSSPPLGPCAPCQLSKFAQLPARAASAKLAPAGARPSYVIARTPRGLLAHRSSAGFSQPTTLACARRARLPTDIRPCVPWSLV